MPLIPIATEHLTWRSTWRLSALKRSRSAEESLQPFVTADGMVAFETPALVITADKA